MPFVLGETIGPYRLVEQLGQGGMATVYKAYHASLDRFVAIKALHPAFLEDPNFLARFQREARLVARLEHPNIVPIYDFAEHEGRPYLVMKYIEGETLKAALGKPPLPQNEILAIADAVGAALQYAHDRNILHRDVKPSNVILSREGQVFLADFGLARIAQGGTSTLTSDMLVGTPQYISPEQAQSKPDLDGRTDIYSFGVMLYEMFVGRVPFSADTPFSIIHDHIYTPLPLPRLVNPAVPEAIERVLLKALAKDPEDRFPTVNALIHALHAAVKGLSQEAQEPAAPPVVAGAEVTRAALPTPSPEGPAALAGTIAAPAHAPEVQPEALGPRLKSKKKIPVWVWIGAAMVLVLLCLVILGGLGRINQNRQATQTAEAAVILEPTPNPTLIPTRTPEPPAERDPAAPLTTDGLPPEAQKTLELALEQWKNGQTADAQSTVIQAIKLLEDNPAYTTAAINRCAQQGAWAPAAMIGGDYYRRHPNEFTPEQLVRLHEALYRAAGDGGAHQFFQDFAENPVFQVAKLRFELYFGGGTEAMKADLGQILSQPLTLRRFPEAKLLEVELFLMMGDQARAREAQAKLLNDRSLPEWVLGMAKELEAKLK